MLLYQAHRAGMMSLVRTAKVNLQDNEYLLIWDIFHENVVQLVPTIKEIANLL